MPDLPIPASLPGRQAAPGPARRIGRTLALELGRLGFAVAVHYGHARAEADAVVAEIAKGGGKAVALSADLTIEAQVRGLIASATGALGPLGVLVNNASLFERDEALTVTRESWDAHLE